MMRGLESFKSGAWLTRERLIVYPRLFLALFLAASVLWIALSSNGRDLTGKPLGADFLNVYAAGVMAVRGQAAEVYDWAAQYAVEKEAMGGETPFYNWPYPPPFLGIASLFAGFSYPLALALYVAAGALIFIAVLRRSLPRTKGALWALLAFPGVFVNAINGQNGFLTTALLAGGFSLLQNAPVAAGALLGCLVYKPQFFVLVPFVLFLGHQKKVALAACAMAAVLCLASFLVFGGEVWRAFFASAPLTQHIVLEDGNTGWQKIQSVFSVVRSLGGGLALAYATQGLCALVSLVVAVAIWRRDAAFEIKASALVVAALLVTPYVLDYDLVILAVPLALSARRIFETQSAAPYEKSLLALLWLLPFLARGVGSLAVVPTPFVLGAFLVVCWRSASARPSR